MHTWVDSDRVRDFVRGCAEIANLAEDIGVYVDAERAKSSRPARLSPVVNLLNFRYGYLPRLLDDSELSGLEGAEWRRTRRVHRECFWKNVSLLDRDSRAIFKNNRRLMADQGWWNFEDLTRSRLRMSGLILSLRAMYVLHFLRMPYARAFLRLVTAELSAILIPLAHAKSPVPQISETIAMSA